MLFEVSGVEISWWIPSVTAFFIGLVVSTGGLSGAFVLLPFQVSVLGFVTPAVTATNHLYNVCSIPSGVYSFIKQGRMVWPLTAIIVLGSLPGVAVGSWLRVAYLPDAKGFKLFVGFVLLFISSRMLWETVLRPMFTKMKLFKTATKNEQQLKITKVKIKEFSLKKISYTFSGNTYSIAVMPLFLLSVLVGVIGGAYGVGGGAIIAPFLITFFRLPVYTTAGATLMGTFSTSLFAVIFFSIFAPYVSTTTQPVTPDWQLGALFGLGGFFGIYLGARLQKLVPQQIIKAVLGIGITTLALRYIVGYFMA